MGTGILPYLNLMSWLALDMKPPTLSIKELCHGIWKHLRHLRDAGSKMRNEKWENGKMGKFTCSRDSKQKARRQCKSPKRRADNVLEGYRTLVSRLGNEAVRLRRHTLLPLEQATRIIAVFA